MSASPRPKTWTSKQQRISGSGTMKSGQAPQAHARQLIPLITNISPGWDSIPSIWPDAGIHTSELRSHRHLSSTSLQSASAIPAQLGILISAKPISRASYGIPSSYPLLSQECRSSLRSAILLHPATSDYIRERPTKAFHNIE